MKKTLTDFDQTINAALEHWHIPGAAVAVVKGDEVLHSGGYGLRDIEQNLPVTETTRFPIASMTKPFTAMGAAILVDQGLLKWDQPIRDVLPEFRLYDDYATQKATLRDLLSHRTGLPRHDATWYGGDQTFEDIFTELKHLKTNAAFRSQWQYNNLMYEAVGYLCSQVTGSKDWHEFINTHVLNPLGLARTTSGHSIDFTNVARPYRLKVGDDNPYLMASYNNPLGPAGSIHSTLDDVISWLKVHTHNGKGNGVELVSPHNLKQMHLPHMLIEATAQQEMMFANTVYTYGLGWFIEPYKGVTLIHHGGNINGYSVMGAFVPQEQLAIAVLTNIDSKGLRNALTYEAVDRALGIDGKDWSHEFLKRNLETEQSVIAAQEYSAKKVSIVSSNIPPTYTLQQYAGSYQAKGYADIDVHSKDNILIIRHYGEWWPLNHYQHNVFKIDMRKRFDQQISVRFELDNLGFIDALHVPVEPALGDMPFKRKPIVLDKKERKRMAGHYSHPIQGLEAVVTEEAGDVYLAVTGQAKKPLHCIGRNSSSLIFNFHDSNESAVEFTMENGEIEGLVISQPGAAYTCIKK